MARMAVNGRGLRSAKQRSGPGHAAPVGARGMNGGVALVASPGGHVDEAFEIADRFAARGDRVWITARTTQTATLLRDEHVEWVPEVKSREAARAVQSLPIARDRKSVVE